MSKEMMKCGHVASAYADGKPVCAICVGITPNAEIVDDEQIDLTGRMARCSQHKHGASGGEAPSKTTLPFFKHCPDKEYDEYYCGCWGWN